LPAGFFLTRSRGERGGRKIGFSPRAPRLRVNRCRGFSSASRIFSHAEARRARREEDWIFSASPRLRVNLYSPSSNISFLHRCRGFWSAQAAFFLTRSRGERGGRKIGFSPRAPRLRVNRYRGFSFASRIFSHAEARRARRKEDWIFSAPPREPLPKVFLLKRRSVRRSAPRPGSAPHGYRGGFAEGSRLPAGFFLTRSRGERGGRKIGFSPRLRASA
jgi:hypothetical protein